MRMRVAISTVSVLLLALVGLAPSDSARPIDDARLRSADRDAANWLMYGRTRGTSRPHPETTGTTTPLSR